MKIIFLNIQTGPRGHFEILGTETFPATANGVKSAVAARRSVTPSAQERAGNPWQDASVIAFQREDGAIAYDVFDAGYDKPVRRIYDVGHVWTGFMMPVEDFDPYRIMSSEEWFARALRLAEDGDLEWGPIPETADQVQV